MTDQLYYYLRFQGEVTGPLSVEQLRAMNAQGRLQPADEVSIDQLLWDRVADRADLFPWAGMAPASNELPILLGNPVSTPDAPPMVLLADDGPAPARRPRRRPRPRDDDDDEYDDAPPPSSSGSGLVISLVIFGVVGLGLVVVVVLAAIAFVGARASTTFSSVGGTLPGGGSFKVTRANFDRIELGMSFDQVIAILGYPDAETNPNGNRMLTWWGSNGTKIVVELDKRERVLSKEQSGLP